MRSIFDVLAYGAALFGLALLCPVVLAARANANPTRAVIVTSPSSAEGDAFVPGVRLVGDLPNDYVEEEFFVEGASAIFGATDPRASAGMAPVAIGLGLTLIHLIRIPVTNTSVNPARSTGPALFAGGAALSQLWLFWVAPIVGAVLGGVVYKWLGAGDRNA